MSVAERIHETARQIAACNPPAFTIMEVCGTHSHAIARYGLKQLLPENIRLISGPGCPVCVTADEDLDRTVQLARQGAIIATFGDMVRVPGPLGSLADARANGADVRVLYSPVQSLELAEENPDREVVLLGIGFETTTPGIGIIISEARDKGLRNFSVYTTHKVMPPPMEALISDPASNIDAYLCPGHVSTIIGADAYKPLAEKHHVPCAVGGFEPTDIMDAIAALVEQVCAGVARVDNCYTRAVSAGGNPAAQAVMEKVFEPCDANWRGLGIIPESGLAIREEYTEFDAARRFDFEPAHQRDVGPCLCGDVLQGKAIPTDCPAFGTACTPQSPIGACMVSSEGSCAAVYRYTPRD